MIFEKHTPHLGENHAHYHHTTTSALPRLWATEQPGGAAPGCTESTVCKLALPRLSGSH
jgi:hypothetical protein